MKLSLSANISKLRKEHAMTQEQLAEALGSYLCICLKMGTGCGDAGIKPDCGDGRSV